MDIQKRLQSRNKQRQGTGQGPNDINYIINLIENRTNKRKGTETEIPPKLKLICGFNLVLELPYLTLNLDTLMSSCNGFPNLVAWINTENLNQLFYTMTG